MWQRSNAARARWPVTFIATRSGTPAPTCSARLSVGQLRFNNDPPDRDYFHAGAGLVLVLPGGFSPFLNYRALLGYNDQSGHAVTVGLRFPF